MPYRLIPEEITEVSIVDIPANKRKFIVVKQLSPLEDALAKLEEAIDAVDDAEASKKLADVRATILRELGRDVDEGRPLWSLAFAADVLEEIAENAEGAVKEALDKALELLDSYLSSQYAFPSAYPAPYGYPSIGKESDGMEKQTARRAMFYGPYPYMPMHMPMGYPAYPHPYGYGYGYGYPYGYAAPETDLGKAVQKLIAAVQQALEAAKSLEALVSEAKQAAQEGAPANAEKGAVDGQVAPETEKSDVEKALGEITKALQELVQVSASIVTSEKLAELVKQEIERVSQG